MIFLWRRIFRNPPVRNPPAFLPRPLLRAGNQPRQGESIPPDKLFRLASSALVFLIIWILLEIVSNFVQQTPHRLRAHLGEGGDALLDGGMGREEIGDELARARFAKGIGDKEVRGRV